MCLLFNQDAKVETTTEEMVVYKVVLQRNNCVVAIYQDFMYSLTDVMVAEYFNHSVGRVEDYAKPGLASYRRVYHGFHSFVHERDACNLAMIEDYVNNVKFRIRAAKFIIPMGTRFIRGVNDDKQGNIVSEKLKFMSWV